MNVYKLIFVNNLPISVKEMQDMPDMKASCHLEQHDGKLIHAIVKSETKDEAMRIVHQIIKSMAIKPGKGPAA